MAEIKVACNPCGGTGVLQRVSGLGDDHTCHNCGGDGIVVMADIPLLDDIMDKCNDIMEKCNEIKAVVDAL